MKILFITDSLGFCRDTPEKLAPGAPPAKRARSSAGFVADSGDEGMVRKTPCRKLG